MPRHCSKFILSARVAARHKAQQAKASRGSCEAQGCDVPPSWRQRVCRALAGSVLLALSVHSPATAEPVLRLPVSETAEIQQVQKTLFEAWDIVNEFYFDTATLVRAFVAVE